MTKIDIRKMTLPELGAVLGWAAAEGWNPGVNDAECFYGTDPDGFFIASDENGTPLGAISGVAYGQEFGFIGLYIVRPEYRGHDIGPMLGHHAMDRLGDRTIGLDGVEKKIKNYEAYGFKTAHHNIRYEGVKNFQAAMGTGVSVFNGDIQALAVFDRKFFPADRTGFLKRWTTMPCAKTFWINEGNELRGYGVVRKCVEGFKIGPLFADNPGAAEALFLSMVSTIPENGRFYLDMPEPNKDAENLASKHKMKSVFGTARMYNRDFSGIPLEKIYGITTFELG